MKLNTAISRKSHAIIQVNEMYHMARVCHMTSETITERYLSIIANLGKIPYWVRSYLDGRRDALTDNLYREYLEYCSVLPDGTIVSHYSFSPRYYQVLGISPSELSSLTRKSGHYWKNTDKPYYLVTP